MQSEPPAQPEQQQQPVISAQPTELGAAVTTRSGLAASAENLSSAEKSTGIKGETEKETEDFKDIEL